MALFVCYTNYIPLAMALFHPEWVTLGTSSYSLVSVLDQTVDLLSHPDWRWAAVDQTAEWIFTKLPKSNPFSRGKLTGCLTRSVNMGLRLAHHRGRPVRAQQHRRSLVNPQPHNPRTPNSFRNTSNRPSRRRAEKWLSVIEFSKCRIFRKSFPNAIFLLPGFAIASAEVTVSNSAEK